MGCKESNQSNIIANSADFDEMLQIAASHRVRTVSHCIYVQGSSVISSLTIEIILIHVYD